MDDENIKKLVNRIERALELIESAELNDGINLLKAVEERLRQSPAGDQDVEIITFHNLAMCYQLLEDYEKCKKYLQKTIKITKSREYPQIVEKIRIFRYLCILYLHLSASMSHLGDHASAVIFAKESLSNITKCLHFCVESQKTQIDLAPSAINNCKTLETCLLFISGRLSQFPAICSPIIQRTSLGVRHFTDWIYSFSINDLFELKPLKFFEVKNAHTFEAELSKDYMLEKVCLLVSTCYLVATESRIIDDQDIQVKAKEWHARAVCIGINLLPLETPVLQHIRLSFKKHYPEVQKFVKITKSRTPLRKVQAPTPRNRTVIRLKNTFNFRKNFKELNIKTERNPGRSKIDRRFKSPNDWRRTSKTKREIQEPEPQMSDESEVIVNQTCIIDSQDLYGPEYL
jgi:hypothetical protein